MFTMQWLHYRKIENTVSAKELERLKYSSLSFLDCQASYCVEETIGFDIKASLVSRPVSHLIKSGDITKEF